MSSDTINKLLYQQHQTHDFKPEAYWILYLMKIMALFMTFDIYAARSLRLTYQKYKSKSSIESFV